MAHTKTSPEFKLSPKAIATHVAHSAIFDYYTGALFPQPLRTVIPLANMVYDLAKKTYSERFDLSRIGTIFTAWSVSVPLLNANNFATYLPKTQSFQYEFDKFTYKSTVLCEEYTPKGRPLCRNIMIKLSNDGFLYSKTQELQLKQSNLKRHHSETWCELAASEVIRWFQPLINYACSYFSVQQAKVKVFYSYDEDIIDFFGWNTNDNLIMITFEPGYPDDDFEDEWINCSKID
jgi:hypothetical protein